MAHHTTIPAPTLSLLASGAQGQVAPSITYLFGFILALMIAALALEEKLHAKKSIITGVFAVVTLFLGTWLNIMPFDGQGSFWVETPIHHRVGMPIYIPAIDWGVIAIILGSSLFVDVVGRSGLFTYLAIKLTKASQGDPVRLLIFYGIMTVLFSALLNNVTAMLIVGSLTAVSLDRLKKNQLLLGFLLVEGLLTNIGGLLTLISSVPNIIVGNAAGFSFVRFTQVAALYVVLATALTIAFGIRTFGVKRLASEEERIHAQRMVAGFDETDGIESWAFFRVAAIAFVLFILTLASASWLPVIKQLNMGYVALTFAFLILIRYKNSVSQFYQAVDWDLLLFFASLFIVINVMEHAQVLALIGNGLKRYVLSLGSASGSVLLAASAAASAVTDNIPLAAMMAKIIGALPKAQQSNELWWSIVFGANLGGNITPIGSASTVVAVTVMHKYGLSMSFARFVRTALPFALMQIVLAIVYILVFVRWLNI
jgi:Na+/H+ antiporter NhaD/arsenite permease-like protein